MTMQLTVDGRDTFVATGGRAFDATLPVVVFVHGAGLDHTVWMLLARWFAHHGYGVLAPDLPGHGRSGGKPLTSIVAMADWTGALLGTAGVREAGIVGLSMGSLIALEAAARHRDSVTAIAMIGAAAAIPVSKDLLAAASADDHAAIDMVSIWGFGYRASLGGSLAPGAWMLGNAMRLLERSAPGVLSADLIACNEYRDNLAAAAKVTAPATLVLGERDLMTPHKAGLALAAALPNARAVTLKGAGHLLLSERPDEVLAAVKDFAAVGCLRLSDPMQVSKSN
jgi:pimeloyl-ACP methyl ester carboxylesterase